MVIMAIRAKPSTEKGKLTIILPEDLLKILTSYVVYSLPGRSLHAVSGHPTVAFTAMIACGFTIRYPGTPEPFSPSADEVTVCGAVSLHGGGTCHQIRGRNVARTSDNYPLPDPPGMIILYGIQLREMQGGPNAATNT